MRVLSGLYVGSWATGRGLIRIARQRRIVGRAASKLGCLGVNGRRSCLRANLSCGLFGLAERRCQITPLRGLLSTGRRCCSGAFQRRSLLERRRAESRRARSGLPLYMETEFSPRRRCFFSFPTRRKPAVKVRRPTITRRMYLRRRIAGWLL